MEISQQAASNSINYCALCFAVGNSRCGRCRDAFYCGRQHQIDHWPVHKEFCKKFDTSGEQTQVMPLNPQVASNVQLQNPAIYGGMCQNLPYNKSNTAIIPDSPYSASARSVATGDKVLDFQMPSDEEIFSSFNSELLSSDNNFWDIINTCDAQDIFGTYPDKEQAIASISEALQTGAPTPQINMGLEIINDIENMGLMHGASLHDICSNIVHDLSAFGICVLDNFVGSRFGNLILNEVKSLYHLGIFKKGELVNSRPLYSNESIRNDVTTWVDGNESNCNAIGSLIKKLDVVIAACNKLPSELLSKYKLHRRTKAMIACYPGDGTYYKKHIDNPHQDGRCITCIYYLNQNWNTKQHGGLLRMFPSALDTQVANIEPIFDRMLFFFSDKRNPHEVLPAYATRFAITVWYFDADERDRALLAARERFTNATSQCRT